ncbi:MAG TPA: low specificity L-threonine aldolase [Gemmatimonadaceae bacterium]
MTSDNTPRRHFASDNWAGVHPEVLTAIARANLGHVPSYGFDDYTKSIADRLAEELKAEAVYFVFTGTGANVLALETLAHPHNAVICADTAHVHTSECGAVEKRVGCKLLLIPAPDGKIDRHGIAQHLHDLGDEHHVQPSAVSISQATEYGTTYSRNEIEVIAGFAHDHDMRLHMDGARLVNAAAFLDVRLRDLTSGAGVDVLSLGATKNGALAAEAVIFFDKSLAKDFVFQRMQGMQLSSKMRFVAAQFDALFSDDLWLRSARHANAMAELLASELRGIAGIRITQRVEANEVFAVLPREMIARLQEVSNFQVWVEEISEARFVTSFDTTEEDVRVFGAKAREIAGRS